MQFYPKNYAKDVRNDINEAHNLGLSGVPFFLIDKKYSISGAQSVEAFLLTLQKAYTEWQSSNISNVSMNGIDGELCTPKGNCD